TFVSLCGVKWIMRLVMPMAAISAALAFLSAAIPAFSGAVDWHQAFTFKLTVPFDGWFGQLTSVMAGLYLVCYAAPAFEQAACHVGETIDPNKNVPRAMFASAGLASLFFIVLPVIWLGALGPESIAKDLAVELGPTFAPLLGGAAKAAAVWFIVLSAFHASIAPLAGAARVLAQLAEDGLLPEFMARRSRTDAPWVATLLTAATAILIIFVGIPLWLIAATNFTYLIGICLPSVAVWLLRKNQPQMLRPYRAPRGMIVLGLFAAGVWALATILGFQQFGLPTVLAGVCFACLGAVLYPWRKAADRRKMGLPVIARTLHLKLTGAMLLTRETALMAVLADIFVLVALLTMVVGLILPGMIAHAAVEVSAAADRLVKGTLADFTRAMRALAAGDLDAAKAQFDLTPVRVHSRDEVGDMAENFNRLQAEIGHAATGLEGARKGLQAARDGLELRVEERTCDLRVEVTERRRSEQAVMESQRFLQSTLDALSAHIAILDESGVIIAVNAVWNRFAQSNAEATARLGVGVNYLEVSDRSQGECAEEAPAVARGIRAVLAGEAEEFHLEYPCHSQKEQRWFIVRVTRFGNEGTRRIVVAHENITERKQAEMDLRLNEQRYRSLVKATTAIVWDTPASGEFEIEQPSWSAFTGQSFEEYRGWGWLNAVHPDDQAETARVWSAAVASRNVCKLEHRLRFHDQTFRNMRVSAVPILAEDGTIKEWIGIHTDITQRKLAEETLRLLSSALEQSRESIVITDAQLDLPGPGILFVNPAFTEMTGYTAAEVIGATPRILQGPKTDRALMRHLRETLARGEVFEGQTVNYRKDGTEFPMEWQIAPVRNAAGIITHQVAIQRDITKRKDAETERAELNRQLIEVSHHAGMAEIATSVLHNIGNVLNSVNVSCSVISDKVRKSRISSVTRTAEVLRENAGNLAAFFAHDPIGTKVPEFLGKLAGRLSEEQADVLGELQLLSENIAHIKDIVAVQQSHAKNLGGIRETLSVEGLVEDALRMSAAGLHRHRIEVVREYGEVPPVPMEKHKVLQILVNLVRNAKHAIADGGRDDKQLLVRIARNNGHVAVSVSDNGIGIAAENLTRIFAHGFTTKKDGHGFGLHSGVLAAQEMGGCLAVQSDGLGHGATFTLELPLNAKANEK
ncbi:MAG: amino acid permease, partial [Chthoniobacteraceae bacterium]